MNVSITITGTREVRAKIKKLGSSIYDLKSSMSVIGRQAADYYANQGMLSQGGVFGSGWKPLSARYAARKAKLYPGRPILVATGTMKDSFNYSATSTSVLVGNTAPQFKYHQSSEPRTKIPRRPMLGVNDQIKRMVREELTREITQKIKAA